ncbi:hypothetical protein JCM10207_003576 [Rhodosporidiobolus poonsookiae]
MAATDSSSSWVNTIPAATQIVPSIGLDGQPIRTSAPSTDDGGDTFPSAAIAVIAIFAGIAGLIIAYKLYRWRSKRRAEDIEPVEPEGGALNSAFSPKAGGFASLPSQMSMAFNGGGMDSMGRRSGSTFGLARSRQASWGGESWSGYYGEKGDLTPSPPFAGTPLPPGSPHSREGSPGPGGANGSHSSLAAFPSQPMLPSSSTRNSLTPSLPRRSFYSSSASGPQLLHSRTASSFGSSSPHLGSGPSLHSFPSGNRLSGAPHSPHSRIEVIPPTPLAPPPGSVIRTDKSTLDFAPSSGIGRNGEATTQDEWLSMVHTAGQGGGAGDVERLNPAFDGSYVTHYAGSAAHHHPNSHHPQYPPHSFPPPPSSTTSGTSSRSSSAAPRAGGPAGRRASNLNLRAGGGLPPSAASASTSANSSDSNLSSASSAPAPGARRMRPPPVDTSASALSGARLAAQGEGEPRSPLEKLQEQMEREARGLGLVAPRPHPLEGEEGRR